MRATVAAIALVLTMAAEPALADKGPDAAREGLMASDVTGLRERAPAAAPRQASPWREAAAGDRATTSIWGWPLVGVPTIARGFDPPEHRWSAGHRGIDLAGVAGESVLAVEAGVVTHSGVLAGVGMVSITHANGLRSTYQPLTNRPAKGDRVARGGRIGQLEPGGHCLIADCLHLGAVRGRDGYVDPTPLLLGVELTLRPIASATP